MTMGKWMAAAAFLAVASLPVRAEILALSSPHDFDATLARVERAVEAHGMFKIATASASRAAAGAGFALPGDAVVLVFRNDFARRILAARPEAGIEAPFIVHIRQTPGGAMIAWKRPSAVYAPYAHPEIDAAARELDAIFAAIAATAAAP
jgi:uncharacterized protein (DUF302 family)